MKPDEIQRNSPKFEVNRKLTKTLNLNIRQTESLVIKILRRCEKFLPLVVPRLFRENKNAACKFAPRRFVGVKNECLFLVALRNADHAANHAVAGIAGGICFVIILACVNHEGRTVRIFQ